MNQLLWALLITLLPVFELRAGMPLAIDYALKTSMPVITVILLVILVNCLVVLLVFWFLDVFHNGLLNFRWYNALYKGYLKRIRGKVDRFEERHATCGFLALVLFVAVPLPGTGAWTGCIVSWILGLERKQSIAAIMLGVIMAGILIALASLGIFTLFFS